MKHFISNISIVSFLCSLTKISCVELTGNTLGEKMRLLESTSFSEAMLLRMSSVSALPSGANENTILDSLEIFLEDINPKFSELKIKSMKKSLEKLRETDQQDLVLALSIDGNYESRNTDVDIKSEIEKVFSKENEFISMLHEFSENTYFSNLKSIKYFSDVQLSSLEGGSSDIGAAYERFALFVISAFPLMALVALTYCACQKESEARKGIRGVQEVDFDSKTVSTTCSRRTDDSSTRSIPISEYQGNDDISITTTRAGDSVRGECRAPPGKLGVALDTVGGVVVVHRVRPGSPLQGVLSRKDRIVAIDEIDTTNMTAAEVTKLMVVRMKSPRTIAFVRGGDFLDDQSLHTNSSI